MTEKDTLTPEEIAAILNGGSAIEDAFIEDDEDEKTETSQQEDIHQESSETKDNEEPSPQEGTKDNEEPSPQEGAKDNEEQPSTEEKTKEEKDSEAIVNGGDLRDFTDDDYFDDEPEIPSEKNETPQEESEDNIDYDALIRYGGEDAEFLIEEDEQPKENESETTPTATPTPTGISSAYVPTASKDIYGNVKKEEPKEKKEKKKAPERSKPNDIKGDTIMEMMWNEIWGFVNRRIDWATDRVLDFADFVFFTDTGSDGKEKHKTNVYAVGQRLRNNEVKDSLEKEDRAIKAYDEFLRNLENDKNSRPVKWDLIKEPSFFREISALNKKDPSTLTAEEKDLLKYIKEPPLKELIDKERNIQSHAINVATCDVAVQKQRGDIFFEGSGDVVKALEVAIGKGDTATALLWADALSKGLEHEGEIFNDSKLALISIREGLRSGNSDITKEGFDKLKKQQEELMENPDIWGARVGQAVSIYTEQIKQRTSNIEGQDKHTISSEFTTDLRALNGIFEEDSTLTPEEKKARTIELVNKMNAGLTEDPLHQQMKEHLNRLKVQMDAVDLSKTEGAQLDSIANDIIGDINQINNENDPRKLELASFYSTLAENCLETKEATEACSGILSRINKDDKIRRMNESVVKMKDLVFGVNEGEQPQQNTRSAEAYVLEIMNGKAR